MSDTAKLGAFAFLSKSIQNKKFTPIFMRIRCPKCGYSTESTDSFYLDSWRDLIPKRKLHCPICNTPMIFVTAILKGRGRKDASDDAPAPFQEVSDG